MSCVRSLSGARVGDPSSGLGSSSSTCSSSTYSLKGELGKRTMISGGWIKKSTGELEVTTGGSGAAIEGIRALSRKISRTEEEDREAWK